MRRFRVRGDRPTRHERRDGAVRIYLELAQRSFRQQFAYRAATLAGLFTNSIFGVLLASVYMALYANQPDGTSVGGFDVQQTITYVWIGQALIMPVFLWGWWQIVETIRTGAVVTDLLKPVDYFTYWLSRDLGRAAAHMIVRMVPTLIIGALLMDLVYPDSAARWAAFLLSVPGAIVVSFCFRYMMNLWGFWLLDSRGLNNIIFVVVGLFSGHLLPISWYPSAMRAIVNLLPFRSMIMTPVEIWLGQVSITQGLLMQAFWAVVMTILARALTRVAERKVVVQGG